MIPKTVTAEIAAADNIMLFFLSAFLLSFILAIRSLTFTFFEISGSYQFDEPEYESSKTLYYNTLNKSVENHLEIGCDFKMVHQYFLNTQKAKVLVFSNTINNVPGYYNWFANKDDRLDFNTFNKLKEMGCHRN